MEPLSQVLAAYPAAFRSAVVVPLGNSGGFSGARLWRLETVAGAFCLREAAPGETRLHLEQRHALIARARNAGLVFVPAVLSVSRGNTVVECGHHFWEMMEWMPGRADFRDLPSSSRLHAAVTALARVHYAWQGMSVADGPLPAIARRLEAIRPFGHRASATSRHPLLEPLLAKTRSLLRRWLPEMQRMLSEWEAYCCALQPCLRDVWHDHLLFTGDDLTGLVDYAAAGVDGVAADLARMLGSLIGDDDARWRDALEAYRSHRPFSTTEECLARVLDRTGAIGALCTWLRRLEEPRHALSPDAAAVCRLEDLLKRVETW
jgi:Ser/Thr protein kinase RdoA (MazF antagonist)